MASITISREDKYPNGTSVAAYEVVGLGQTPASGAPPGSAVDTDTVTGGSFTFTGLDDSTEYIAYASSPDRYLRFSTPPASATASGGSGAILPWVTATAYVLGQPVTNSGQTYTANDAHTSGATFAGDLASHWTPLPITSGAPARAVAQAFYGGAVLGTRSQQVGMFGSQTSGTNTGYNTRTRHPVGAGTTFMRLVYRSAKNAAGQVLAVAPVLVDAGLESPSGTIRPVTFGGKLTGTWDPGATLSSDPIAVNAAKAAAVFADTYSRTAGGSTTSGAWPMNVYTSSGQGEGVVLTADTVAPTDLSKSGTIPASDSFGFGPLAVVGAQLAPAAPTVGAWGDSIVSGVGDTNGDYYVCGFLARALNQAYGWINLGLSGDTMSGALAPGTSDMRTALLPLFSNVVVTFGTNDMASVLTLAQIQAAFVSGWTLNSGYGARVFQTTVVPRTTSSDSFATTANQTTVSTNSLETKRQAFNAWLRGGAPVDSSLVAVAVGTPGALLAGQSGHPLYAVWDTAATVESTTGGTPGAGGSVWKASKTVDGIHPEDAGAALMAAGCTLAQLAA